MYVLGESLTLSVRSKEQGKGCYIHCCVQYPGTHLTGVIHPFGQWIY